MNGATCDLNLILSGLSFKLCCVKQPNSSVMIDSGCLQSFPLPITIMSSAMLRTPFIPDKTSWRRHWNSSGVELIPKAGAYAAFSVKIL